MGTGTKVREASHEQEEGTMSLEVYYRILNTEAGKKLKEILNGLFPGLIPEPVPVKVPVQRPIRRPENGRR